MMALKSQDLAKFIRLRSRVSPIMISLDVYFNMIFGNVAGMWEWIKQFKYIEPRNQMVYPQFGSCIA